MPEKSRVLSKPAVAGLFFRVGKYSWFWGRGRPAQAPSPPETVACRNLDPPLSAWSNVAEWLKRMHAQADRPAAGSANQER